MTNATVAQRSLDDVLAAIAALDLDPIKVKLMHEESGEGWPRQYADQMEVEYRRFLELMVKYPNDLIAPTMDVDEFWHYHILDTMKYAEDCQNVFGHFLHHFPYLGLRGEEDLTLHESAGDHMRQLYMKEYGVPPGLAEMQRAQQAEQKTAWSGAAVRTAWSGAAVRNASSGSDAPVAWSGAAARTAWSGAAVRTAWSGAAVRNASSGTEARTAWSGAAVRTAWSGAAVRTAWSGAAVRNASSGTEARTAWSGAAVRTAWSGAAVRNASSGTEARTAWSGAAVRSAWSGAAVRNAAPAQIEGPKATLSAEGMNLSHRPTL